MGDGLVTRVLFGDGQKTFESPEKQRGASNAAEKLNPVLHVMSQWRNGPRIVIEFPKQGTVGFPVRSVQGQVTRDFVREPRVDFLHARNGCIDIWITLGPALFPVADSFNQVAAPIRSRPVHAVPRREAEAFNGHGFLYAARIHARVVQDDAAPEGMANKPNREVVDDVEERGQIENV